MKVGVVFPQTETTADPVALRHFATAVEEMGYAHMVLYDHVLGASPDRPGGWRGPYTDRDPFHEVFVTLGHVAALTTTLELVTGVLILPQRQTALVAKQAAEVDILSGGRLRLGIGLGWNRVEYQALGVDFARRGRRVEEQVDLLRRLWAEDVIDFHGEFHEVPLAGINPRPGRAIPIWMGGTAPAAKARAARVADGWMMNTPTEPDPKAAVAEVLRLVDEAGRRHEDFGVEVRCNTDPSPERTAQEMAEWRELGVTHVTLNTMQRGLSWPDGHLEVLGALAPRDGRAAAGV